MKIVRSPETKNTTQKRKKTHHKREKSKRPFTYLKTMRFKKKKKKNLIKATAELGLIMKEAVC